VGGIPLAPERGLIVPGRERKPNGIAQQIIPLLLLGIGLVTTNNSVTFLDDESLTLGAASSPFRTILARAGSVTGARESHPLFDVILHFWLPVTGGNFDYLRIPSILFLIAGLFLLGRASRRFTGPSGGIAVIWLGVLWPFSFHFGRVAAWYPFSFFLVAGLTLSYLEYLENQTKGRWAVLFVFCVGLIWTTYFSWAILACLAVDQILRARAKEPPAIPKALLGMAAVLCVLFVPFFSTSRAELSQRIDLHQGFVSTLANAGLNSFSFFVSESIAPWYWKLSVPAGLAFLCCIVLVARWLPRSVRRFLIYSAFIMAVMALAGILRTKDLLTLSPWVLLPAGVAIETAKPRWATFALAAALLVIGAAGWYGIYSRHYYSDLRWIEPWQEVAGDAAAKIGGGATVIADHPSFLFYLTYILRVPKENGPWRFQGLLAETVKHPQVFSSGDWLAAGHPANGKILLIRTGHDAGGSDPIDVAEGQLDQSCGSISSRLRMRDEGYFWKRRFLPQLHAPMWRIEIREYDCDSSNSKQIYHIPPP
jgi:hypothetical protein